MNEVLYVIEMYDGYERYACGYFDTPEKAEKAKKMISDFCAFDEDDIEISECGIFVNPVPLNEVKVRWYGTLGPIKVD